MPDELSCGRIGYEDTGRPSLSAAMPAAMAADLPLPQRCSCADPPAVLKEVVPRESLDLALAADHVIEVFQRHRIVVMASPDWSERDRAAFDLLRRATDAFWSRDPEQER